MPQNATLVTNYLFVSLTDADLNYVSTRVAEFDQRLGTIPQVLSYPSGLDLGPF